MIMRSAPMIFALMCDGCIFCGCFVFLGLIVGHEDNCPWI
jgi:hypothetical protein